MFVGFIEKETALPPFIITKNFFQSSMIVHLCNVIEINEIELKYVTQNFENILKIIENILKIFIA